MTIAKKRVSTVVAGAMVAGILLLAGPAPAQAAGQQWGVGPFSSLAACQAAIPGYISSWTKISQGCTYYPVQGGFTASGYYFHYRTIG
ncbi:hypothetical protein [Microbacterium sp. EST19A]|uniref:hypothetical protein n=1 Tax=Microbacterium sp. EST19A TaxID=2862681 RepID=UPI001CBC5B16|nr:hypothetical protein [Microbacterium sp. EST19A]